MADGHFVLCQRARLIRADDGRTSERLDRGQALYKRVLFGHTLHRHSKRQRHGRQQALRYEGHYHAERKDERLRERLLYKKYSGKQERHADSYRYDGYLFCKSVEFLLERACFGFGRLGKVRDTSEFGAHAYRRDYGAGCPARNAGTGENKVWRLEARHVVAVDRLMHLAYRIRLAGKRRLVYLQIARSEHSRVGRYLVSLLYEHQIARHEFFRRYLFLLAAAYHARVGRKHLLKRLRGLAGTEFLHETENAVDDVDQPYRDTQYRSASGQRYRSAYPQQDGHKAGEIPEKHKYYRLALLLTNDVRAKLPGVFGYLLRSQAFRARTHLAKRVLLGQLFDFFDFVHTDDFPSFSFYIAFIIFPIEKYIISYHSHMSKAI